MIIKNYLLILLFLMLPCIVNAQEKGAIQDGTSKKHVGLNDGPYVFIEGAKLIEKRIVDGVVVTKELKSNTYDTIYQPEPSVFKDVSEIVALSDIHGQYDLAIEILKNNKIIDDSLHWNFGNGHLVVVGDVFDRGEKVNEVLWFLYKLESEAKDAGGKVHLTLGNHEYMILHKDLRYLHVNYILTSQLLNQDYDELYSNKTIIGRWLRSKSTIIKINDNIFVHGGISKEFISTNGFELDSLNETMRKSIDRSREEMRSTDFYTNFYGSDGPIWYRGYFYDNLKKREISRLLKKMKSNHIVVGHCSNKEVVSLYDNKIFGVDSSIKLGKYGEVLFMMNDEFYRGTKSGIKKTFNEL